MPISIPIIQHVMERQCKEWRWVCQLSLFVQKLIGYIIYRITTSFQQSRNGRWLIIPTNNPENFMKINPALSEIIGRICRFLSILSLWKHFNGVTGLKLTKFLNDVRGSSPLLTSPIPRAVSECQCDEWRRGIAIFAFSSQKWLLWSHQLSDQKRISHRLSAIVSTNPENLVRSVRYI